MLLVKTGGSVRRQNDSVQALEPTRDAECRPRVVASLLFSELDTACCENASIAVCCSSCVTETEQSAGGLIRGRRDFDL